MDLCATVFETDIVHKRIHQQYAPSIFRIYFFDRRWVWNAARVITTPFILDDNGQFFSRVNATRNMDSFLNVLPVSVQHRIGQRFAKRDLYITFVGDTTGDLDQRHQPVH